MGGGKWFGGILGWVVLGPIGGLIGFALGALIDSGTSAFGKIPGSDSDEGTSCSGAGTGGSNRWMGQRNSFIVSLLVLSTAVIKADGKYLKNELDYVREFIRRSFGDQAVPEAMEILKGLKDKQINVYEVGGQIRQYMNYSQRMQLFHYLVALAQCDGDVCSQEIKVLHDIGYALGLSSADTDSILAMFKQNVDSAYKILEIDKNATDDEVKKAYKRMALKHHPDKVASLGPDVQKSAEEKFKTIQEAYEKIKKERNMV
ncbi:MAG: TerB family tellurite resistance protein [Bacteroidales bacterium]|nr:TerB family tellurite resistance protein [Bacteroidales bacterium]MDD4671134.1 TerB family tellurite resistance protein [Bacteroidales bacterium]